VGFVGREAGPFGREASSADTEGGGGRGGGGAGERGGIDGLHARRISASSMENSRRLSGSSNNGGRPSRHSRNARFSGVAVAASPPLRAPAAAGHAGPSTRRTGIFGNVRGAQRSTAGRCRNPPRV